MTVRMQMRINDDILQTTRWSIRTESIHLIAAKAFLRRERFHHEAMPYPEIVAESRVVRHGDCALIGSLPSTLLAIRRLSSWG